MSTHAVLTTTMNARGDVAPPAHGLRMRRPPVHVLSRADPEVVLLVASKRIVHLPRPAATAASTEGVSAADGHRDREGPKLPLYLCEAYARGGTCDRGDACDDVHADASQARRLYPHRRHADDTTSPAATAGKRLPAALGMLEVAFSNEAVATQLVAAGDCLATRALEVERRPLSVCAHFVKKGVCNYGARCQFVHPLADPVPIHDDAETTSDADADAGSDVAECDMLPTPDSAFLPPLVTDPLVLAFNGDAEGSTPTTNRACEFALTGPSAPVTPRQRYQHDPYGVHGWASVTSLPGLPESPRARRD